MKTKIVLLGTAICLALGMASCKSNTEDSKDLADQANSQAIDVTASTDSMATAHKEDAEAMVELASGGMMEVELAKIALQKATSPKVKKFAQMVVDDHLKTNEELKNLADNKNIVLPATLIDEHQKVLNEVSEEKGKQFDRKYMDVMLEDHKKDIDMFQKIADKGNDADLKAFAAKVLPTLIHHREEAEKLEKLTDKM